MRLLPRLPTSLAALLLALGGPAAAQDAAVDQARPPLALMGTIPIYWGEADGLGELLSPGDTGHWARAVLERHFEPKPLDYLSAEALAGQQILLLAQPRALSADENVSLDAWVRGGGVLLLFADPMMTGESRFNLGDRRRPQDVALLSPILAHWGMELRFDDTQQPGLRNVELPDAVLPVNLPGNLALLPGQSGCELGQAGLVAVCAIGAGVVTVFADAALLDIAGPHPGAAEMLDLLAAGLAQRIGENAGTGAVMPESAGPSIRNPTDPAAEPASTGGTDRP